MTIEILKEASPEILEDINALLRELRSERADGSLDELERIVADPDIAVFISRDQEHVVGIAFLFMMQKIGKRNGYVEDVVVSSTQRGKGLGRAIMQELITHARTHGLSALYLTSKPAREAANALYQKLGFELQKTNPYRLAL
jgi:ribosomal protein S18 acetylase RimI-like enzyme